MLFLKFIAKLKEHSVIESVSAFVFFSQFSVVCHTVHFTVPQSTY